MELRDYLSILKRHGWFVLEVAVVAALLIGIGSSFRSPQYRATAEVLLQADDPSEQLRPENARTASAADPDRYVAAQRDIAGSEAVAREAAKSLNGLTTKAILDRVTVTQRGASDLLEISALDIDPTRARDIANSVASGFIEHRRRTAVAGLQRAVDDIVPRLNQLQARLAEIDKTIGGAAAPAPVEGVPVPTNPTVSVTAPADQVAARYAAAVQYESLYARQQELLVNISLKRGGAEMIAKAKTPKSPVFPNPERDAALGGLIGLLLGAAVACVRDRLDDRLRSATEIERATGMPILTQLPYDEESDRRPSELAAIERPLGPLAESIRTLRTSIFFGADEPVRVIVVVSPSVGEGKSLVAANLAVVYAQAGYRTNLVSADLRRPGLSKFFPDGKNSPGLSGLLTESTTTQNQANGTVAGDPRSRTPFTVTPEAIAAALVPTVVPELFVLASGSVPSNPSELLGSRRMADVLMALRDLADVVVIDTSAILPVTDGTVLAAKAEGVVLVAAVGETRRETARRAASMLHTTGAHVLGVVANKVEMSSDFRYESSDKSDDGRRKKRRSRKPATPAANGAVQPVPIVPDDIKARSG
ncbi:MAG TPA: hypothetical protein VMZ51_02450 [Acidimicrobiales bacterium]|nr:hypothetical protein [Acidimicrobiales bacterium]